MDDQTITITILLKFHLQQELFNEEETATVHQVAEFSGLFHARWFLKAPLAASSPCLDLCTIMDMIKYASFKKAVSTAAIKSFKNHLHRVYQVLKTFIDFTHMCHMCHMCHMYHLCQDEELKQYLILSISSDRQKFSVDSKNKFKNSLTCVTCYIVKSYVIS